MKRSFFGQVLAGRPTAKNMNFSYTYVLMCSDGDWYIGSTDDIKRRMWEHENGEVTATTYRRPLKLVYFEACRSLKTARERERQLKTGFGRGYFDRRLAFEKLSIRHNA